MRHADAIRGAVTDRITSRPKAGPFTIPCPICDMRMQFVVRSRTESHLAPRRAHLQSHVPYATRGCNSWYGREPNHISPQGRPVYNPMSHMRHADAIRGTVANRITSRPKAGPFTIPCPICDMRMQIAGAHPKPRQSQPPSQQPSLWRRNLVTGNSPATCPPPARWSFPAAPARPASSSATRTPASGPGSPSGGP
jgi:hypothetical protein